MRVWRERANWWGATTLAVVAIVLIVVTAVPAYAVTTTTWYVATTGNDAAAGNQPWTPLLTIGKALEKAVAGDTIKVGDGTYTEDLSITKNNIELTRWDTAVVKIEGVQTTSSTLWPLAAPNIDVLGNGVKIHGLTIRSPVASAGYYSSGVVVGGNDVEIYDNTFETASAGSFDDVSQALQTYNDAANPTGGDVDGLSIHDNTFTSYAGGAAGYEAIYINHVTSGTSPAGTVTIDDNDFGGTLVRAITTERSKTDITDNTIASTLTPTAVGGTTVVGENLQGINVLAAGGGDVDAVAVTGNSVTGFSQGLRVGPSGGTPTYTNITVTGNDFSGNTLQVQDRNSSLDISTVIAPANTFDKAVVVDHPGSSLLHTIWSTIQAAIDAAVGGDTVQVAAGTYTENVTVGVSLSLQGAGSGSTTVASGTPSTPVINVTASSVEISGFTISGATPATTAGVYINGGVTLCNVHDNHITNNGDGIWLGSGSNHNTIKNNDVSSNTWQGLEIYISSNNTFEGNTANSNTSYGFKIDSGDSNTFTGNTANSNGKNGFYAVVGDGGGTTNTTFEDNTANSNTEYGIRINGGTGNTLTGNTFSGNVKAGIRLKEPIANLTVESNIISGSQIGVDIDASVTDVTSWSAPGNCITGNTTYGISNAGGGTLDAAHNWWGSVSGPGGVGPGSGDAVTAGVNFLPWLNDCGGADVTLPTITVTLPEFVVQGVSEPRGFTVVTDNPDTTWNPVGYSVKVDHAGALVVGNVELEYKNGATWDAVTLAVVGDNLEGPFGPQGFSLGTGTFTYDLRAKAGASAPTGTYTVTVSLKLTSGACETIQTGNDTMPVNPAPTISLPGTTLPAFVVGGAYQEFGIELANPADGASYAHVLLNLRIQGPAGSDLTASMFRLQSQGSWNDLPLTEDGNDLVADFGGPAGFAMASAYDQVKTFRAKAQLGAPTGTYSLVATLFYLDAEPDWTLSTRTDPFTVDGGAAAMSMDFGTGWNMVSVPVVGADAVPETVFADVITSGQPLVIYEWVSTGASSGAYAIPTEIDAGCGYWLYLFKDVTVTASGPLPTGQHDVTLALDGWHQISTPKWPINWSALQFSDGTTTYSFADAAANNWIWAVAYSYDPVTNQYVSADLVDGAIDPWMGYWICTRIPGLTMIIPMDQPYIPVGPASVHLKSVPAKLRPPAAPAVPTMSAVLFGLEFANSPNPIRDVHTTTFYVQGKGADLVAAIRVEIYDQSGHLVYESIEEGPAIEWHTDNEYGEYLANGVYLYKLYVRIGDTWIVSEVRKLAILR
jgi:parallel beta-helix repeat protein